MVIHFGVLIDKKEIVERVRKECQRKIVIVAFERNKRSSV